MVEAIPMRVALLLLMACFVCPQAAGPAEDRLNSMIPPADPEKSEPADALKLEPAEIPTFPPADVL